MLIYLMMSFSTANASFWCLEEQSSPHLQSSPIGKCWTDCDPENPTLQPAKGELAWTTSEEDCLDSPVHSSALTSTLRINSLNRIAAVDIDSIYPPIIVNMELGDSRIINSNFHSRLPTSQSLEALRTVIFLH